MRSLKESSLIRSVANLTTLLEVFMFCKNQGKICYYEEDFWKVTLTRIFGSHFVRQRGDLSGIGWYNFVKALLQGITYEYSIVWNSFRDDFDRNPLPYYMVKGRIPQHEDDHLLPFKIPGLVPVPGTRGYFIIIQISGKYDTEDHNFVVGPPEIAFNNAARYVAEYYHTFHTENRITRAIFEVNEMEDIEFDRTRTRPFPSVEEILNTVSPPNVNTGIGFGLWFASFGYLPHDGFYTETSFYIAPIEF